MIPINIRTDNSLLSSLIKIDDLIAFALKNDVKVLTITDNNMYGVIEFYDKCLKNSIKPIVGINIFDIILYATNYEGYKNLLKLTTIDSKDNITFDILEEYNSNLICIVPYTSLSKYENLKKIYKYIFRGYNNLDERNNLNGNNLIFSNEILCLEEKDTTYLKYLYRIKSEDFSKKDNYFFNYNLYEMDLENNSFINDNCNLVLPMHQNLMPIYKCPDNLDSFDYIKVLVKEGLKNKIGLKIPKVYIDRLKYELDIINKMGFCNYFLIVWDYVKYAKEQGILVGPGRGSAAGSLVAFLLNITEIDPIKYDLLFERFLNPERISMPDIDIDFEYTKRDEVLKYCINKYGEKKVAPIITFGTLSSKQVIRDVGKVLNVNPKEIDYLSKLIEPKKSLKENYNKSVKEYLNKFVELRDVYKISLKLEGLKRHSSIHAAGIVISEYDIDEIIPLEYHDNFYITGYSMEYLEQIGLLKMDLLALKNLTLLNNCLKEIKMDDIPLNDKKTLDIFTTANTIGIFQFESAGMINFISKFKPNNFDDITACIALYRPGPMGNIDTYIKRKNNLEQITYLDERLISILKSTYGIIVYQEQIMLIANVLANYTLAEADLLRKAMSKKRTDILLKEKERFINRCDNKKIGEEVYELILKFASYGFNKAHSVSYALIAYKMAYIKAYYTSVFMKNLLSMVIGSEIKTREYIMECKKNGITVLKPDINLSSYDYVIKDDKIIYPLTNIKSIGYTISSTIIEERKKGLFKDIFDFISRCNIGIKTLEILNKAGCFQNFINQKTIDNNIEIIINYSSLGELIDDDLKPILIFTEEYTKEELMIREVEVFGTYLSNHPVSEYRNTYQAINLIDINKYYNKTVNCLIYVEKYKKITTKNGDNMMFITGSDEFSSSEFILFPRNYQEINNSVYLIKGKVERRFDKVQIIINEMEELK